VTRILVVAQLAVALVFAGGSSPAPRVAKQARPVSGISVRLLPGWQILHQPISDCYDPKQKLAVASFRTTRLISAENGVPRRGVLILLLEDHVNPAGAFPARPARFRLHGRATRFEACCDMPTDPGYELMFSDRGRDFEAFVQLGAQAAHARLREAIAILNSLRVGPS
jgi:hypothetical protein